MPETKAQDVKEAILVAESEASQGILLATEVVAETKAPSASTTFGRYLPWLLLVVLICVTTGIGVGFGEAMSNSSNSSSNATETVITPAPVVTHGPTMPTTSMSRSPTTPVPTTLRPTSSPTRWYDYSRLDGIWGGTPISTNADGSILLQMSVFGRPNARGYFISEFVIQVTFPDDATYVGTIDSSYNTISWSNKTTWKRKGT